jgi:hypothetical protein
MMTRTGVRNSNKALPADIQAAFSPMSYYPGGMGVARLHGNAHVVQQTRTWPWGGMRGIGDTCIDSDGNEFDCGTDTSGDLTGGGVDTSILPTIGLPTLPVDASGAIDGGSVFSRMTAAQQAQFEAATPVQQQSMLASMGVPAAQIATVLSAAGIAASNAIRATQGLGPINPVTGRPYPTYTGGSLGSGASNVFLIGAIAVAALFMFGGRGR